MATSRLRPGKFRLRPPSHGGYGAATAFPKRRVEELTEAMYSARETAMERMQSEALALKGSGVVEVKLVKSK